MPVTVKVNGAANSLVHKGSNAVSTATIPDVCKTPSPGGPVPIPYPNVSQSTTLAKGTTTVKADGMMVAVKGSEFSMSNGDEPGTVGGVKSSTFIKESTWILYSFDVKIQGKNACRLSDKKFQNHENSADLMGTVVPPTPVPPPCPPHTWVALPDTKTVDEKIADLETSGNSGDKYNACLAKQAKAAGHKVDVSLRFKCSYGDDYQEVDLAINGSLVETKAGNQSAKKKQTLNYKEISSQHFDGNVTVAYESAARFARDDPHVRRWGATPEHRPC